MKNKLFYFTLIVFCCSAFVISSGVFAQMNVSKWTSTRVISGKLTLGISSSNVTASDYSAAEVTAGITKWTSTTAHLNLTQTSFSVSNVDLMSVSGTQWNNNGWGSNGTAWTQRYAGSKNCNPTPIGYGDCTASDAITYTAIYLNSGHLPDGFWASTREDRRKAVIAHELGHAFTLDHNAMIGQSSIMRRDVWDDEDGLFSYDPTAADVNDINSRYY
jgi:hypothetical protein